METKKGFSESSVEHYSSKFACSYIFNYMSIASLTVIPGIFAKTGWLLGLIGFVIVGAINYCTCTFIIETMAITNALYCTKSIGGNNRDSSDSRELEIERDDEDEVMQYDDRRALLSADTNAETIYEIKQKVELTDMVKLYFNKFGQITFYILLFGHLYGAFFADVVMVTKSATILLCGDKEAFSGNAHSPCRRFPSITVIDMYRIMISIFALLVVPFVFFDITKSKYMQLISSLSVWLGFSILVVLAAIKIGKGEGNHSPVLFQYLYFPRFISAVIYASVSQFALGSVMFPVIDKRRFHLVVLIDYIFVIFAYSMTGITAAFAFSPSRINDVYTSQFSSPDFVKDLLKFIPIFPICSTFITASVAFRENIATMLAIKESKCKRIVTSLVAVVPPLLISCFVNNIEVIAAFIGTYFSTFTCLVIPTILVYLGRIQIMRKMTVCNSKYQSPFKHKFWILFVLFLAITNTILTTYTFILFLS